MPWSILGNNVSDSEMLDGMSCEMASGASPAGIKKQRWLNEGIIKKDDRISEYK